MLCQGAGSRAGSPEPQLPAEQLSQPDFGDAEAVRLAALALQMSQVGRKGAATGLFAVQALLMFGCTHGSHCLPVQVLVPD